MSRLKKLTALLASAALVLALLAGCGGSKALSQVIAGLLSGQYNNVTVEVDPDLTAALKKAAAAGSTQEEVLAALVENLNLSGVNLSFNNLGDGQQGQHGVTLTFQPGSDPDAAARSAFTEWNRVFSSLPDDGSYRAHVSMIEAEGGYYIAVDVEVLRAGTPDRDDPEPDPDPDCTISTAGGVTTYTVYTQAGFDDWVAEVRAELKNGSSSTSCILKTDVILTDDWTPIGTEATPYTGTFDGQEHTIDRLNVSGNYEYAGLFGYIQGGTVKNLTLVSPAVSSTNAGSDAGAVAGYSTGTIENCHVTVSGAITGYYSAGGVVGQNGGDVTGCSSSAKVTGTGSDPYTGGVVGINANTVTACSSTGDVTATGSNGIAGGVVGDNYNNGEVIACYATGNVTATDSDGRAGGVVGFNSDSGTVTACYATGDVTGNTYAGGVVGSNSGTVTACYHANGTVSASGTSSAGGVVGFNQYGSSITACYWSGTADSGIGSNFGSGDTTEVDNNNNTWAAAVDSMNNNITTGWWYVPNGNSAPTQFTQTKLSTSTTP